MRTVGLFFYAKSSDRSLHSFSICILRDGHTLERHYKCKKCILKSLNRNNDDCYILQ